MMIVEPRYVPKSVTMTQNGSAYTVKIAGLTLGTIVLSTLLILFAFFVVPVMAFFAGFLLSVVLFCGSLGFAFFLLKQGSPAMTISAQGVEIAGKMYRHEDIQDFREGADDSWIAQAFKFANLEFLGLQYGIYSVRTPYLLSKVESVKVAPYLTKILQHVSVDFGKERDRKIQQAEVF